MTLNEIAKAAHETAKSKGWYENPPSIADRLVLIHSEISEALESYREGKMDLTISEKGKPEGFPSELADVIIRVADAAEYLGIDLEAAVAQKMEYNKTRPHRHGGKAC